MPGTIFLSSIDVSNRVSTIWTVGEFPPVSGHVGDGTTYICGQCRSFPLALNVGDGQLWDIDFRCPSCHKFSRSPTLPAGAPLPRGTVGLRKGDFHINASLDLPPSSVIASITAIEARRLVAGWGKTPDIEPLPTRILDAALVSGYLDRLRVLLMSRFDEQLHMIEKLAKRRGSASELPRIARLIANCSTSATSLGSGQGAIFLEDVVELSALVELMERWRRDPGAVRVFDGLVLPEQYHHSLVLLVAISNLTDLGNGVGLYGTRPPGIPVPDFWIQAGANRRLDVEVKAPEELQSRNRPLSREDGKNAFEKGRRKALKGKKAQLQHGEPGVLLLGGAGLTSTDLMTLEEVVTAQMASHGKRYPHIAAVMLLSFNLIAEGKVLGSGEPLNLDKALSGGVQIRYVPNPSYGGSIQIRIGPLPTPPRV